MAQMPTLVVVLGCVAHGQMPLVKPIGCAQNSQGCLGVKSLDNFGDHVVGNLANILLDQGLSASPLGQTDLGSMTLAKPGSAGLLFRAPASHIQLSHSFLPRAPLSFADRSSEMSSGKRWQPEKFHMEAIPGGSHHPPQSRNPTVRVATMEGAAMEKPPLAKQQNGMLPTGLSIALLVWAVAQEVMSPAGMHMTLGTGLYVLATSYFYTDYWLWMLHCFLDREENVKSSVAPVAAFSKEFQEHHDYPKGVLYSNHVGDIDMIVTLTAGTGLLLGPWTSAATKLIALGVVMFGRLGGLNHFYGHAITHGYDVPAFYKYGQKFGLLPSAKHHSIHHTAPHEQNWNFLNGLHSIVYQPLYYASNSSYTGLFALFWLTNPVAVQAWHLGLGMLGKM